MKYQSETFEVPSNINFEDRLKVIGTAKQSLSTLLQREGVGYRPNQLQVSDKINQDGRRTIKAYFEA